MLNPKHIKQDFPIFNHDDGPFIYLDSASTSQKPRQVLDAVNEYYESYNANIHRALYTIGEQATESYEKVRGKVRSFLNVPDTHAIVFTRSTTEAINLISYAWGYHQLVQGDEILITEMEHHSNLVPWQLTAKYTRANLKYLPLLTNGTLDLTNIDTIISPKTKLVSLTHQSNVFGTINPVKDILLKAKSVDAVTVVDGAQSVPHSTVDLWDLNPDFFAFSGHKMLAPTGVGVLIGRKSLLDKMDPFLGGGEMIETVSMENSTWNKVPWKFEAGTPNIAQVIGLGAAIEYLDSIGMENIYQYEHTLLDYTLNALSKIDGMTLLGSPKLRGAVIPFNVNGIHPHDLAKFLDQDGICIRAGHHCAQPIMNKLGISATARASLYLYNTEEDVDCLCKSIKKTAKIFS